MIRADTAVPVALCVLDDWSVADIAPHALGDHKYCQECGSKNFLEEETGQGQKRHFSICCSNGKTIDLDDFDEPGPVLRDLLTSSSSSARAFRDAIRSYNSALGFLSVGATVSKPPGHGPPVYRVQGAVYHYSGPLLPKDGDDTVFAQIYLYDSNEAARFRARQHHGVVHATILTLQEEIKSHNKYAASYLQMTELLHEEEARAARQGTEAPEITMRFSSAAVRDAHRYNQPTVEEVAAIFVADDGAPPSNRDIVIYPRSGEPRKESELSEDVDPMCYPILFPNGVPKGWEMNAKISTRPDRTLFLNVCNLSRVCASYSLFCCCCGWCLGESLNEMSHVAK